MLIFGHRFIESENFYHIPNIQAIKNTPPNSTIYLDFSEENLDIIKQLKVIEPYQKHINNNTITETSWEDWEDSDIMNKIPSEWFLTQVGSKLREDIDSIQTDKNIYRV